MHSSHTRTRVAGRTMESQIGHLPVQGRGARRGKMRYSRKARMQTCSEGE